MLLNVCRRFEGSCTDRGWCCRAGHDYIRLKSPKHHTEAEGVTLSLLLGPLPYAGSANSMCSLPCMVYCHGFGSALAEMSFAFC